MPLFSERPFTSITVKINQLCKPHRNDDLEDDSIEIYVTDLLDLIKLQHLGATEAARAIRKKIKYGNTVEEQMLALQLLELLVLNSGPKIGQVLASDDKLLDLLRNVIGGNARTGLGDSYDKKVIQRTRNLAIGWKDELSGLDGYKGMANLWKAIPRKQTRRARLGTASRLEDDAFGEDASLRSRDDDFSDDDSAERADNSYRSNRSAKSDRDDRRRARASSNADRRPPPRPTAASPYVKDKKDKKDKNDKKDKKTKKKKGRNLRYADEQYKIPQINYRIEAPKIRTVIADCYTHTTALNNHLLAIPAGSDPLSDKKVAEEFDRCRKIRHKVLRYLQFVGAGDPSEKLAEVVAMDEEFLGSLIVANEQLVTTFKAFDKACGYTEENPAPQYSDDDDDEDSEESYYLSDSDLDLLVRMDDLTVESSSRLQEAVRAPPPPRPQKPEKLRRQIEKPISEIESAVSVDSADPFGDSHEVEVAESRYY